MKYVVRGKPRYIKDVGHQDIDCFDNLDDANKEAYSLRLEHPSWVFWISEENEYDQVQKGFRPEPELSL